MEAPSGLSPAAGSSLITPSTLIELVARSCLCAHTIGHAHLPAVPFEMRRQTLPQVEWRVCLVKLFVHHLLELSDRRQVVCSADEVKVDVDPNSEQLQEEPPQPHENERVLLVGRMPACLRAALTTRDVLRSGCTLGAMR